MIANHLRSFGPAFLAVAGLALLVDHSGDGPLYAPKPAYANVARVPAPYSLPAADASKSTTHFSRASDGLFYVRASVNGVPVRFVLDTGATLVVLTPEDARRVGLSPSTRGMRDRMETAGGFSKISRVKIDHITLAGHAVDVVDAAIVDNGMKTSLLGQAMLSRIGPITLSADQAAFR